jgi:hypothetical protein
MLVVAREQGTEEGGTREASQLTLDHDSSALRCVVGGDESSGLLRSRQQASAVLEDGHVAIGETVGAVAVLVEIAALRREGRVDFPESRRGLRGIGKLNDHLEGRGVLTA